MVVTIFLLAGAAGISFWNYIGGRFEGDRLERSLRIPVGRYYLHLHHWFYCLGLMAVFSSSDVSLPAVYGFLAGSIVQGLAYRDCHLLMYDRQKAEGIYARWRP